MTRQAVTPAAGAPAIGPYSPALRAGSFLFLSGQIPLTAAGTVVDGGIREQTTQVLENMRALLEADPNLRTELKRRGFLTRDSRAKERKKAGLKKARKRPQFSKR